MRTLFAAYRVADLERSLTDRGLELVQWPRGHPYGHTAADFTDHSN